MPVLTVPQNDNELYELLREYFDWNTKHMPPPLDSLNGLRNIMLFVQDFILDKISLRDGLRDRLFDKILKAYPLIDELIAGEPRLNYAVKYVFDTTKSDWGRLDYNLKYWFMVDYVNRCFFNRHSEFPGIYSVFKHRIQTWLGKKNMVFFEEFGSPEFAEKAVKEDGRRTASLPVETLLCLGQIDLYYYTRQQLAFDHGMDLVQTIDAFFIAPHAQGQYASLLPPEGPTRIPVTELPWLNTPEGKKYANITTKDGVELSNEAWDMFVNL